MTLKFLKITKNLKKQHKMTKKIHHKITIFEACTPYPRLIYWIASSISQGKKDDMSSKSEPCVVTYKIIVGREISFSLIKIACGKQKTIQKKKWMARPGLPNNKHRFTVSSDRYSTNYSNWSSSEQKLSHLQQGPRKLDVRICVRDKS